MEITVKYFASLRDTLNKSTEQLSFEKETLSIAEVWKNISAASGSSNGKENILCALNKEYVNFDHLVIDGDELAFFPPVSGG